MKKHEVSKKIAIGALAGCMVLIPTLSVNAEMINGDESNANETFENESYESANDTSETNDISAELETDTDIRIENAYASTQQVKGFVERLYTYILNRQPDANGLQSWTNALVSGREQGAKVAQGFIQSPEFINRNLSNTEYIKVLYKAFLGREADTSGLKAWEGVLNDGLSRMHVFKGFAESSEEMHR